MSTVSRQGVYCFGCSDAMPVAYADTVRELIEGDSEAVRSTEILSGRGYVIKKEIEKIGSIVLKQYHRGGLLGKLNPSYYLSQGEKRPETEFKLLNLVRTLSVNAPEPLMWVTKGSLVYQGWLVMREIPHIYSLAQAEEQNDETLEQVLRQFAEQVERLILAGIYHVDLHPGNVLIGQDLTVSIIDFDKARICKDAPNRLRDRYLCRWRRAVIKHGLPDYLAEYVCAFLRKNFALHEKI